MANATILFGPLEDVTQVGSIINFKVGSPPVSLTINDSTQRAQRYTSANLIPPLFSAGDYVAVAVRPAGLGHVLLAYRKIGLRGPAHPVNLGFLSVALGCCVLGATLSFAMSGFTSGLGYLALWAIVGIPVGLRLVSVLNATKQLQAWQPPV
jgi:hypothetical protein